MKESSSKRLSIRTKAMFWFTVTFTFVSLLSYLMFSRLTILEADEVLQDDLTQALEGAAEGVDVEMLLSLAEDGKPNEAGFSDDPRYIALLDWLDTIHQAEPDVWPYLYIESEKPGYIYFVVDLYARYNPDFSSKFMEPYESQSGYILIGLEQQTYRAVSAPFVQFLYRLADQAGEADRKGLESFLTSLAGWLDDTWLFPQREFGTYTDKYGSWASGYMPLETPPGQPRVGIGMDFQAEFVNDLHGMVQKHLSQFYLLTYVVGLFVIYFLSNRITKPIITLKNKAEMIGNQGDLVGFSTTDQSKWGDEIDELEDMLSQMVDKIRLRDLRYEAVVSSQADLIIRWKADGTFTFFNTAFREYFPNIDYSKFSDINFSTVIPMDRIESRNFIQNVMPNMSKEKPYGKLEITQVAAGGEEKNIQWVVTAIFDQEGKPVEYQAVGRDITELKDMNTQLDSMNKKLHQMTQQLLNEREKDRTELARELHDEILNYISELFMSKETPTADALQDIYQKIVNKIRSTIYDLRPPMLNYGLHLGLEDFVDGLSERYGSDVEIVFDIPSSVVRFDPDVEIQLFRIVQEAVGNALTHANANSLHIRGEICDEVVSIFVEDDGSGFDFSDKTGASDLISNMQFGVVGMQERAGLINAKLDVDSVEGKGTTIRLEWIPDSGTNGH